MGEPARLFVAPRRPNQNFGRDAEHLVHPADLLDREATFAAEHFGD
jgi:hypothetical protein